jgi:hypothetical protein
MGKERSGEERKNASLPMLLERIKGITDDMPLDELKAQFEEYKRVCENIKPHRNKRTGHTDQPC